MYEYKCDLDRVIDGDTVDAWIQLGLSITVHKRIRLLNINAPETRTKNLEEKEKGLKAKQWLIDNIGQGFIIKTEKDDTGKYGRIIGTLFKLDGTNINQTMVKLGLADDYFF